LLSHFAQAPINHVLRGESWALRRLQPFAGRTARFEAAPFSAAFVVRASGEIAAAQGSEFDVTLRCSPLTALRILGGEEAAYREVDVTGDAEFAQAIEHVVRNARWDFEEELARVFGDVAAHRTVGAARALVRMHARAVTSVMRNLSDYIVEERGLIARRTDVEAFMHDVDALRDDVERLGQRVTRLAAQDRRT
jgi:ubiquinone biosynthesis protein UbiJ